jgi:hypothetical protein
MHLRVRNGKSLSEADYEWVTLDDVAGKHGLFMLAKYHNTLPVEVS